MSLIDMTINDFVEEIDSSSPAPGGGSVAALASDIGIGLARMMAHLSFGKKKYEALDKDIKEEFQSRFEKLAKIREELSKLVDEDTNSFNEFMKVIKMPQDTFKQITQRQTLLSEATLNSIKVPYKTAYLSLEAMRELEFIVDNGNQNAITDIGVGTLMLCTGLEGAILNTKVNLMNLEDKELAKKYRENCAEMLSEGKDIRDNILSKIHSVIE